MPQFTGEIARLLMPLFILAGGACVLLAWAAISEKSARAQAWFAGLVHVAALWSIASLWNAEGWPILNGMLIVDREVPARQDAGVLEEHAERLPRAEVTRRRTEAEGGPVDEGHGPVGAGGLAHGGPGAGHRAMIAEQPRAGPPGCRCGRRADPVMLIDTMVPEAARQAGKVAGLVTVVGFAVAAGLSGLQ